jgi:hypothetical protein
MEYLSIAVIIVGLMIFGTGWLQYNLKLHAIFLFVYWLWAMGSSASNGTSYDLAYLLPLIITAHYTLHWVLKQGKSYGKNIPYPTTHRDLRDIHSPDEKSL